MTHRHAQESPTQRKRYTDIRRSKGQICRKREKGRDILQEASLMENDGRGCFHPRSPEAWGCLTQSHQIFPVSMHLSGCIGIPPGLGHVRRVGCSSDLHRQLRVLNAISSPEEMGQHCDISPQKKKKEQYLIMFLLMKGSRRSCYSTLLLAKHRNSANR